MKLYTKVVVALLMSVSVISLTSAAVFNTNLALGSRGNEVKKMQDFLITQGLLAGPSTTYFGAQTKKSVQSFQKKNNIPANGSWFLATRQKADAIVFKNKQATTTGASGAPLLSIPSGIKIATTTKSTSNLSSSKDVKLTVKTVGYGYVLSPLNDLTCYDNDTCTKTVPKDKDVVLAATPKEGYAVQGWSEASCGTAYTCTVKMIEDTIVYARFEVKKLFKPTGSIALNHPKEICYIKLGADKCDLRFVWTNNSGLDMTIKVDDDEYYISVKDSNSSSWMTSDFDPEDTAKAEAEHVSGPVYFGLFQGTHKIALKSHDQVLDTITVDVQCAPGTVWDGTKCWEKGAKRLYVFKSTGVVIKSNPSGVLCGYNPEACTAGFSSGTSVTLKAVLTDGRVFDGWTGDCAGMSLTCTIVMDKDKTVGMRLR